MEPLKEALISRVKNATNIADIKAGTEVDGRNQADKHLKDNSNPYNKFEFITYNGNIHKTKKEEAAFKSGGFVVLSIA